MRGSIEEFLAMITRSNCGVVNCAETAEWVAHLYLPTSGPVFAGCFGHPLCVQHLAELSIEDFTRIKELSEPLAEVQKTYEVFWDRAEIDFQRIRGERIGGTC